jgi:hypothetical protein
MKLPLVVQQQQLLLLSLRSESQIARHKKITAIKQPNNTIARLSLVFLLFIVGSDSTLL